MEADNMVEILRRFRHDYANHFQVISGYEQLGMHERIQDYLSAVMEDMDSERVIFDLADAETALYLYQQLLKAKDQGIILRYEDLDLKHMKLLEEKNEPCASLASLVQETKVEEPIIYVSLYEDEKGIDMFFSCGDLPQNDKKIRLNKE